MHERTNYFFLLLIILSSLNTYGTELTEDTRRNKLSCCCSFLYRLTTRHTNENIREELPAQSQIIIRSSNKISEFPSRVVLNIASFLDYPNQLSLSHLNKKLKLTLVEVKTEAVAFIPSVLLAERALRLGFPKGKENLRQVQHKTRMNQMLRSSGSSISPSSRYIPTRVSSYELIFKK